MTLRITLLVLVTGLFALIWTHDQHPAKPPMTQVASVDLTQQDESEATSVERTQPTWLEIELSRYSRANTAEQGSDDDELSVSVGKVDPEERWELGDAEMPFPAGLVPGEYRAVSNTGIVRDLTVTLAGLKAHQGDDAQFITREIYQSQGTNLRWYFIRVQSDSGELYPVIVERGTHVLRPAVAPRGTHPHQPALAEKDRSRQLRRQASRIIVGAGQRFFQNVAKTLRSGGTEPWDSVREQIQPTKLSAEEIDEKPL